MKKHISVEAQEELAERLFAAVSEGNAAVVRALLDQGVDADAWGMLDDEYDHPLQRAIRLHKLNRLDIIGLLVGAGADLDFQGGCDCTALHLAMLFDHDDDWQTARLLFRAGASTMLVDKLGLTALETAENEGNEAAVLALLDEGLPGDTTGPYLTLLAYASWSSPTLVRALIRAGASVNATCLEGQTALHRAAESLGSGGDTQEAIEIIHLLLQSGANPEAEDQGGQTPADLAGPHADLFDSEVERWTLQNAPCIRAGKSARRKFL